MIDLLLCNMNLSCHFDNLKQQLSESKYPKEYVEICQFLEWEKVELPEYCKVEQKPVRKRNDF
jgi:hypothetical protein